MASLSVNDDYVSVTCGVKTFIVRTKNCELLSIVHNSITAKKNEASRPSDSKVSIPTINVDCEDIGIGLLCSDFSSQGNQLAFCTYSKTLCVVDMNQPEVCVKNVYQLVRGASKVKFTPSGRKVVVADKSGDVYLFDLQKENDEGTLILGHLSLLLDVLVTVDEQFIITCDRDEKIRVSMFPNAYNIVSYCLGHSEFVSSIAFLPNNINCLVSASGDGSVRFWDYKVGKELLVFDIFSFLKEESQQTDEDLDIAAITDAVAIPMNSSTSLVCVTLEYLKMCLVLKCTSEGDKLQCTLNQKILLKDTSPWRLTFSSGFLWCLLNDNDKVRVKALNLNSNTCSFEDNLSESVTKTVSLLNSQDMVTDFKKNIVDLLFKRKFDNVQEYLTRKEARLEMLQPFNKKLRV